jgi:hypothetical protein
MLADPLELAPAEGLVLCTYRGRTIAAMCVSCGMYTPWVAVSPRNPDGCGMHVCSEPCYEENRDLIEYFVAFGIDFSTF